MIKKNQFYLFWRKTTDQSQVSINDLFWTSTFIIVFFSITFFGADYLVQDRGLKYRVYFEWEKKIPFIWYSFIPYFGIFLLPALIPFILKIKSKFYMLTFRLIFAISIASIIFVIFPCELGYPKRNISAEYEILIKNIAGTYNLLPSLHVCLTLIICHSFYYEIKKRYRLFIWLTAIILPLSTLFTYQHHVADVISGVLLTFLAIWRIK